MEVPKYQKYNGHVIEIISRGHFPTTVIIYDFATQFKVELDYNRLSPLPASENINIEELEKCRLKSQKL